MAIRRGENGAVRRQRETKPAPSGTEVKGPRSATEAEIGLLVEAKQANRLLLMSKPNVIGMGIGLRIRGGEQTDERVVKVYVSQKVSKECLSKEHLIPSTVQIAKKRVPVDVEAALIPEAQLFTLRSRPLVGGSSIGPTTPGFTWTGSLGCCVTLDDDNTYILSNNHVLAGLGQLPIGTPISQPSIGDGGSAVNDVVATLSAAVPIDFGTTTITVLGRQITIPNPNSVDCALALVQGAFNGANREIHWIGYPASRSREIGTGHWDWARHHGHHELWDWDGHHGHHGLWDWVGHHDRRVCKMGRTTEYRVGKVVDIDWEGYVRYGGGNLAWFVNQLKVDGGARAFSGGGDSGSLVLDAESNRPVGLLFAGVGNLTFANRINLVMDALNIPRI